MNAQIHMSKVLAARLNRLRVAETNLLGLARLFGDRPPNHYEIATTETSIPRHVVPLLRHDNDTRLTKDDEYIIHSINVKSLVADDHDMETTTSTPLVLLHGYMNGAGYFYRNLVGLSRYYQNVHSVSLLGWGLSSRPRFELVDENIETAEDFFVESLEAWRQANHIDKMILAGHSMGGYISVAYCERYAQNVERLILISPVGVPEDTGERQQRINILRRSSERFGIINGLWTTLFDYITVGDILRMLPPKLAQKAAHRYISTKITAITDTNERQAVSDYLYLNNTLPGSGEYCINRFLTPTISAIRPTQHRIPKLKVQSVSFLYGCNDWMEVTGGLKVQDRCSEIRSRPAVAPFVNVYQVRNAGHLLMIDNCSEFDSAMIIAGGGQLDSSKYPIPNILSPKVDQIGNDENIAVAA